MAIESARDWLGVVEDDLRQVVNNLHGPMPSVTGAAFHCQQAAEKLIKALLASLDIDFPRTHDIGALVGLVPTDYPLRISLTRFIDLTPFAIAYRYPSEDEWNPPSVAEIEGWLVEIKSTFEKLQREVQ